MNLRLAIDVDRYHEKPLYTLQVYDLDNPVNFHSYDCVYYKQDENLAELINNLKMSAYKEALNNLKELL